MSAARPALLIAHRGDSSECPENTRAAFDAAIAARVDGIETDLRLCADGVAVCHDATLERFGGSRLPLLRQSAAALARADVGSWFHRRFRGEGVLGLDELLARYARSATLLLELKPPAIGAARRRALVARTVAAIRAHGARERVRILCFDAAILRMVHRADRRLALVLNRTRPPASFARVVARAPWLGALDCDHRWLGPRTAEGCKQARRELFTWSCNDATAVARALALGVDGVLTDRPAWLDAAWKAGRAQPPQ
jgi:glycerophosphoryl diester phosphodiesterase